MFYINGEPAGGGTGMFPGGTISSGGTIVIGQHQRRVGGGFLMLGR